MTPLPRLMVAPNGARRSKADHPALPITDAEIVATALDCQRAGADGIHVHIRDANGQHEIDADHYRAILDRLRQAVPDMYLQVTSESAGRYSGAEQRAIMVRDPEDWEQAQDFYEWALASGVEIQHILYAPGEVRNFVDALDAGRIPGKEHLIQLVQGSYANGSADSVALSAYLDEMKRADGMRFDWMLCAFGAAETASLALAAKMGGKLRHGDGSLAADNAARVREVDAALRDINR